MVKIETILRYYLLFQNKLLWITINKTQRFFLSLLVLIPHCIIETNVYIENGVNEYSHSNPEHATGKEYN